MSFLTFIIITLPLSNAFNIWITTGMQEKVSAPYGPPPPCDALKVPPSMVKINAQVSIIKPEFQSQAAVGVVLSSISRSYICEVGFWLGETKYIEKSVQKPFFSTSSRLRMDSMKDVKSFFLALITPQPKEYMNGDPYECSWFSSTTNIVDVIVSDTIVLEWEINGDLKMNTTSPCNIHTTSGYCKVDDYAIIMFDPIMIGKQCPVTPIADLDVTLTPESSNKIIVQSIDRPFYDMISLKDGKFPIICNTIDGSVVRSDQGIDLLIKYNSSYNPMKLISDKLDKRSKRGIRDDVEEEIELEDIKLESELETAQLLGGLKAETSSIINAIRKINRQSCVTRFIMLKNFFDTGDYQQYLRLLYLEPEWKFQLNNDEVIITKPIKECVIFKRVRTRCGGSGHIKFEFMNGTIGELWIQNLTGEFTYSCGSKSNGDIILPRCNGGFINVDTGKVTNPSYQPVPLNYDDMIMVKESKGVINYISDFFDKSKTKDTPITVDPTQFIPKFGFIKTIKYTFYFFLSIILLYIFILLLGKIVYLIKLFKNR